MQRAQRAATSLGDAQQPGARVCQGFGLGPKALSIVVHHGAKFAARERTDGGQDVEIGQDRKDVTWQCLARVCCSAALRRQDLWPLGLALSSGRVSYISYKRV